MKELRYVTNAEHREFVVVFNTLFERKQIVMHNITAFIKIYNIRRSIGDLDMDNMRSN